MPKRSAGLLLFRRAAPQLSPDVGAGKDGGGIEVLLVHPGGPYWARRDEGWWTIPKGEVDDGEDELAAAEREFEEELGVAPPPGPRLPLGEVVQAAGKHVRAWAVAGDLDTTAIVSGTFEIEWPPRSGMRRAFPEVDRAQWYGLEVAKVMILGGQRPLLDRLAQLYEQRDGTPPRWTDGAR